MENKTTNKTEKKKTNKNDETKQNKGPMDQYLNNAETPQQKNGKRHATTPDDELQKREKAINKSKPKR